MTPIPSSPRRAFWRGLRDGLPFVAVVAPFALLFGVVARDAGLDLLEIMSMSVIVIAGGSQFTALGLMGEGAPILVVVIAAMAVNLRMAMYSAALVTWLGQASVKQRLLMAYVMVDQVYAQSAQTYDREPRMPLAERVTYYFGTAVAICAPWYVFSLLGAVMGRAIPASLSPDFAVPVCFLALLAPMLRGLPNLVAAGVSVAAAIAFAGVPWNLGLLLASGAAMVAGAQTERMLARRRAEEGAGE